MKQPLLPIFVDVETLAEQLNNQQLQIIDMCTLESYNEGHIPGACHLDYAQIVTQRPPISGLLPDYEYLGALFSQLGLHHNTHLVAYDSEGSGKAARLLWTLAACGFNNVSILNGGRHAWLAAKFPLSQEKPQSPSSKFTPTATPAVIADKSYILAHLDDPDVMILDARTAEEYDGTDLRAQRGGHIPGARNLDWSLTFDKQDLLRLKPTAVIEALLTKHGFSTQKEIIVHCQTHHRSALIYAILKSLGYPRVRGYHGSWSEWGNCIDTPIEK